MALNHYYKKLKNSPRTGDATIHMHRLLKGYCAKAAAACITLTSFAAIAHPNFRRSTHPFLPCHDRLVESWNSIKVSRIGITQVEDQYLFTSLSESP